MSFRSELGKASLQLGMGEAVIYGASFARNMILARMLAKADFGIAAALAMIITLLEFSSKLGISRFVIRDKDGGRPDFIASAHFVQGATAVFSSLAMMAVAVPLSRLFGIREQSGTLLVLAVIPLLNGLAHLDVRRYERDLRFAPSLLVEMIPQLLITLAAWPLALWLGDYRAVVVLLVVKAVCSCAGSHWLAERPYRWKPNRGHVMRMLRFGWPLLITGFLMFGVMQGEPFLVATYYDMDELAPYAAAIALAMAPGFLFTRVFNSMALPVMSRVQDDASAFARRYRLVMAGVCVFSAAYAVGMIVAAELLMRWVYGAKYAGAGIILAWLAAANAIRHIRVAPAIAAMAKGDSQNQMFSNLARVTALLPALAVAMAGKPLWMIASTGLAGELLACAVSFRRLAKHHHVPLKDSLWPASLVVVILPLLGIACHFGIQHQQPALTFILGLAGAAAAGLAVLLLHGDSRGEVLRLSRRGCG